METITTTISVPDRAAVGFGATLDVAYRYSEVNKVDQDALALEGKTLTTGASPVRLPFRMHVVPIDEHTCEVGLEVDFDTTSPQQVEANETFIALLREAIPATIRDRETNPPATVQPDHASPPSMFDRLGPQQLARLFKHLTIPTAMIGLLGLLASIVIFAQAAEGTTITQLGVGPNGTAITESLPGHNASAIVVILALGGELLATVIARGGDPPLLWLRYRTPGQGSRLHWCSDPASRRSTHKLLIVLSKLEDRDTRHRRPHRGHNGER